MKYLLFIIFLLFPFLSKAQTGYRLIYNLKYQIDSTNVNSVSDEIYYLDMFGNESYFLSQNQFLKDSFLLNPNEKDMLDAFLNLKTRPKSSKFSYTIHTKNELTKHYEKITLQSFAYEEEIDLDWKLSDDTLTIGNYLCQRATTRFAGRNYEAWYTTKIPLTAYPYKFSGLLGTIMRIVDAKNHYQFDLMEIQNIDKSTVFNSVDEPQNKISKKEFWKMKKKFWENPELRFAGSGIVLGGNNERMKKNMAARRKRENNPIELE